MVADPAFSRYVESQDSYRLKAHRSNEKQTPPSASKDVKGEELPCSDFFKDDDNFEKEEKDFKMLATITPDKSTEDKKVDLDWVKVEHTNGRAEYKTETMHKHTNSVQTNKPPLAVQLSIDIEKV